MANVTVPGTGGSTTTLSYDSDANAALAARIAAQIKANITAGTEVTADSKFGPPSPLDNKQGLWTQSTSGATVLPHGYRDVVITGRNSLVFGSGDNNENVLGGAADFAFFAAGGSGTIVTGPGDHLIQIPSTDAGSWLIETGGGKDLIIDKGTGQDTIGAGAGANAIILGSGHYLVQSTGQDDILMGSGAATIDASAAPSQGRDKVFGGSGKLDFIGGGGSATVFGGAGSATVMGGSGTLYAVGGAAGHNLMRAGTGPATLFGGGGGDTLIGGGSAPQWLRAGGGNETLTGGTASGAVTLSAGAGKDQIIGGLGDNTYVGGSGQATVDAVGHSSLFAFIKGNGGGTMLVKDLTGPSEVHIELIGFGAREETNALARQVGGANSVTVTLSDHTTITFENVMQLTSRNFV